jgi:hypothetical protein
MKRLGFRLSGLLAGMMLLALLAAAQETRGSIYGRVLDPQGSGIPGSAIAVTNIETNVVVRLKTNETGYYDASLLLPGNYQIAVEANGFKTLVRKGVVVPVGTRVEVNLPLELGTLTDSVTVEADAVMLNTDNGSSGQAIDNRAIMELPNMGNNAVLLAQLAPGMQNGGQYSYMGLHSNMGASDYEMYGNVGGNDWTLDGAPNVGQQRRMAYLPYNDAIAEFKVDMSDFDASVGHTTGVSVSMMTKSGTNDYHGTANWQYWNARWNGTPFFSNKSYYTNLNTAEILGQTAKADGIRAAGSQMPGHSHNYAGTIGGPVRIPKIINGRNKLFFFAAYNGFKDLKADDPQTFNHTVPTMPERTGDFSDLLKVNNSAQYQIYDPLTTKVDPSRAGHVIRSPFPNNIIPQSRLVNPMLKYYTSLMPEPNSLPTDPTQLPTNDYFAGKTPWNWNYNSVTNRYDYNLNDSQRFYARWTWEAWTEDRNDWMYETAQGLNSNGQLRRALNGAIGYTWTVNSSTVIDATGSINEYQEGNAMPKATAIKPSDVGLPSYMDTQAGGFHMIPYVSIANYTSGTTPVSAYSYLPNGYPGINHYRTNEQRVNATHIHGNHTFHAGVEFRQYLRNTPPGGQTGGGFTFDNTYMKPAEDTTGMSNYGLSWAAFELGFPNYYSQALNQPLALSNWYFGGYFSDSWRVTPQLTLSLGFRLEHETGITERYNRLMYFDPTLNLGSYASDVQNAYSTVLNDPANASNAGVQFLKQYMPASSLQIQGGTVYPGQNGAPRNVTAPQWMPLPRIGWAYQINSKTVFRGGYGLYYDTNNVLFGGTSSGTFNSSTGNPGLTSDNGLTWNVGNPAAGASILSDPFPAIYNGSRYVSPVGTGYGSLAQIGSNVDNFTAYNWEHARQQRWRLSLQRQIGANTMIELSYDGSYSDQIGISRDLSVVPAQFYNFTNSRNTNVQTAMSNTLPNPFATANFASYKTSNSLLYTNILAASGFFTGKTVTVAQIIRGFEQVNPTNGLTQSNYPGGLAKTHSGTINVTRRFGRGFTFNASYTHLSTREAKDYADPFDAEPYWRDSNNGRPDHISASGIYQLPFGKGRKFMQAGVPNAILGGWQVSATYQYQQGGLLQWTKTTYYSGDVSNICSNAPHTLDQWFNTSGFVTNSTQQAASYQASVFPQYVSGCRQDNTNLINGSIMREFKLFREDKALQIRLDALNTANHPQFSGPNLTPTSTDFGRVTSTTGQINRMIEITAHIRF